MIDYHIIVFIISTILTGFRPIFFKKYKDYFMMTVFLSLLSMQVGSFGYMLYEKKTKKDYDITSKMKSMFSLKNMLLSILSEIMFMAKQYSFILLPLTISSPLSNFWLISVTIFDKLINKVKTNIFQYLSIFFLMIGGIVMNFDKIFNTGVSQSISSRNYIMGIVSALVAVVLSGFVYVKLQKKVSDTKDAGYVMGVESGGALILVSIIMGVLWFMNKLNLPSLRTSVIMFLLLTFLFNIDILLKFMGFEKIPVLLSIFLSQITVLVSFCLGLFLYKEKLSKYKTIGLIIIIMSSIAGSLLVNKQFNSATHLDKANDKVVGFFSDITKKMTHMFAPKEETEK